MKKSKALVIAPYEGLKETFLSIAPFYCEEIELNIQVGNLNDGLEIVNSMKDNQFDIIISRGGTATLIRNNTNYHVVDIGISGYDYMRTFKMIENVKGDKALIGYSNVTKNAISVNQFMHADVEIFTITKVDELMPLLEKLKKENYQLIIGDTVTANYAKELDINDLLLISGEESVRQSVENAIILAKKITDDRDRLEMMEKIHDRKGWQTIAINLSTDNTYIFPKEAKPLIDTKTLKKYLTGEDRDIIIETSDGYLNVVIRYLSNSEIAIHVRKLWNNKYDFNNISITNFDDSTDQKNDALKSYHSQSIINKIQKVASSMRSIMFIGDSGVGKGHLALTAHKMSNHKMYPFIEIDCAKVNTESFKQFIDVFKTRRGTIHCLNLETLNKEKQLIFMEELSKLDRDNFKLIASAHPTINNYLEKGTFDSRLYKLFADNVFYIPNIAESQKEIKDIIKYYLLKANESLGKQITGIEKEAVEMLEKKEWPYNFDQLEQTINQLVSLSNSSVITKKNVLDVLKGQKATDASTLLLSGTLEEIEANIINEVIVQEGGNVSKAAQRLNISRSTIWRKFKIK